MGNRFPIPPGVVGNVLRAASDPDTSVADLAAIIAKDAVLGAQVLKAVNSASFGLRNKIASVERAVVYLGVRAVRNLVLSLGVKGLVPARDLEGFPVDGFWESSLRRAAAARALAELLGERQFDEFFTMGLCQDLGLLVEICDRKELASHLAVDLAQPSAHRLERERELVEGHDVVSAALFTEWGFPEELTVPVRFHHAADKAPEPHLLRARVAQAAESVADLAVVDDKKAAVATAERDLAALGVDADQLGPLVTQVNVAVEEFAQVLGLRVLEQPTFEEILTLASTGLAELNLSYEGTTRRLEEELQAQARAATELQVLNQRLAAEARVDSLTGLANRRAFEESLVRSLSQVQRQQGCYSVPLLDIDRFKQLNDTHGHQAGDTVLATLGRLLAAQLRSSDVAARYGGEEFSLLLPFTPRDGALLVAERIRQAVEAERVQWQGQPLEFRVSVGGSTLDLVKLPILDSATGLVRAADEALYRAKAAGRNCTEWGDLVLAR